MKAVTTVEIRSGSHVVATGTEFEIVELGNDISRAEGLGIDIICNTDWEEV